MTSIAWHSHAVILYNVLLDERLSCLLALAVNDRFFVNIGLREIAVVAWNMRCSLSCSNAVSDYHQNAAKNNLTLVRADQ